MKKLVYLSVFYLYTLALGFNTHMAYSAPDDFNQQWDAASAQYQKLTQKIYKSSPSLAPETCLKTTDINTLLDSIVASKNEPHAAISCMVQRHDFLFKYLDNNDVADMAWLAYKHNAVLAGDALYNAAEQSFNSYSAARISFHKAKYLFEREQWKQTITTLQSFSIESTLAPQEAEYAYFMTGVALQHLGQHRDALNVYDVIDPSSRYYLATLTNKAVANLKQGWWTDSQINIDNVIKQSTKSKHFTLVDRSHLLMGFVQIQHEFYRDARNSFRDIGIKSLYLTRALSGMGLAAMHQKDFVSALNIFMLLNDKTPVDSYVQQTYMLIPYVYEKLGQTRLAEAKYNEASAFYQQQINQIDSLINSPSLSSRQTEAMLTILQQSDDQKAAGKDLSLITLPINTQLEHDLNNLKTLKNTLQENNENRHLRALNTQISTYTSLINKHQKVRLQSAKATYQTYLNQCQFALARLYDDIN